VQGELLLLTAVHLLLTGLPGAAVALFLARRGEERIPVLLAAALVGIGVTGLLGFWVYYGSHELGQTYSFLLAFGSALATLWLLFERRIDSKVLHALSTPLALWALGTFFLVFFGFLHGGTGSPLQTGNGRFFVGQPLDPHIPWFFAKWFYSHGHHGTPPIYGTDWLASDRPPLQVGFVLAQWPFGFGGGDLNYQILAVCLQTLWIVGLWALLVAAGVGRVTRALTMIVVLVSGLAILNGFYVWPKLLPAAMLLAAAALLITPMWAEARAKAWGAVLIAALVGLGMMGHGSSAFGVLALALVAVFRGLPSWRWLAVAVAVLIVVMAPWSAYQKYGDPPGNRLLKWQLAGVSEVDSRGTLETLKGAYWEEGVGGTLHNKAENFIVIGGGGALADAIKWTVEAVEHGEYWVAVQHVREIIFFDLLPSLGLLLLGPVAMLIAWIRRKRRGDPADWRLAVDSLVVFAVGTFIWGLLMFGKAESRAIIHQGSYLIPILGMVVGVVGLRAVFPRVGIWVAGLWAAMTLALYTPSNPLVPGPYSFWSGLIAAACVVGYCLLVLRVGRGDGPEPDGPAAPLRETEAAAV
jgi:hypothetical protein